MFSFWSSMSLALLLSRLSQIHTKHVMVTLWELYTYWLMSYIKVSWHRRCHTVDSSRVNRAVKIKFVIVNPVLKKKKSFSYFEIIPSATCMLFVGPKVFRQQVGITFDSQVFKIYYSSLPSFFLATLWRPFSLINCLSVTIVGLTTVCITTCFEF